MSSTSDQPTSWQTDQRQAIDDEIAKPNSRVTYQEGSETIKESFKVKLISDTKSVPLPVYNIDIDTVSFNFNNVRIKKYKIAKCKELRVLKLDPSNAAHQKAVQEILLTTKSYSAVKASDLKEEVAKDGQEDPALITPEGVLLNGNRRVAVMRNFYENGFTTKRENGTSIQIGDGIWKVLKVCVLKKPNGDDLDEEELRQLEKRLQNKPTTKEEYGDVNDDIDIRDKFAETFGTRDYTADVSLGGATAEEKGALETHFADLKEGKVKFGWLCDNVELINLIDEHLANLPGDKVGQYDLVEGKGFKGGLTTFQELLKYKKKLEARAGTDDLYVAARMMQAMTALRTNNFKYEFGRALVTLTTPQAQRQAGTGTYGGVDCDAIYDQVAVNSPILSDPQKYINDPTLLEDDALQKRELSVINSVHFQLERALEDPKVIIKGIRETLEKSITDTLIPHNDIEFLENIAKIKALLDEIEQQSRT